MDGKGKEWEVSGDRKGEGSGQSLLQILWKTIQKKEEKINERFPHTLKNLENENGHEQVWNVKY